MKSIILALSLTLGLASGAEAALVGYWNFNEGQGDVAYDASGFGNDGTGLASSWVAGKYGSGTNSDKVIVPYDVSLLPSTSLTISAWARIDDLNGLQRRIAEMDNRYGLLFNPPNVDLETPFLFEVNTDLHGLEFQDIALGEWFHAAVTWDGSTAQFYFNGNAATPIIVNDTIDQTGGVPLFLGREGYTLDEVRIYNTALSQAEIIRDKNFDSTVPEPATLVLLSSGILAIGIKRRKLAKLVSVP